MDAIPVVVGLMFAVMVIGGFCAVVAFIIFAVQRFGKKITQAWTVAGGRLGLKYHQASLFSSRQLSGVHDGYRVHIDTWSTGGENSRTYTRYRAFFPEPLQIGLKLTKQHFFSGVAKFFGGQDVEVGHTAFDESVVVRGRDEAALRAYLTASRRMRIERLMRTKDQCTIDDHSVVWSSRGMESNARTIEATARELVQVASQLSLQPASSRLDAALESQQAGNLDEALEVLGTVIADNKDPEANLLQGEILYSTGQYDEAVNAFKQARQERPDDEEISHWTELAEKKAKQPPVADEVQDATASGASSEAAVPMNVVCEQLFGNGTMSYQVVERFEEAYQDASVDWTGTLQRVSPSTYDLVFGDGELAKATLELCEISTGPYGSRQVQAVVAFPSGELDRLQAEIGQPIRFRGKLAKCDPFMRNLFVAAAERVDP